MPYALILFIASVLSWLLLFPVLTALVELNTHGVGCWDVRALPHHIGEVVSLDHSLLGAALALEVDATLGNDLLMLLDLLLTSQADATWQAFVFLDLANECVRPIAATLGALLMALASDNHGATITVTALVNRSPRADEYQVPTFTSTARTVGEFGV